MKIPLFSRIACSVLLLHLLLVWSLSDRAAPAALPRKKLSLCTKRAAPPPSAPIALKKEAPPAPLKKEAPRQEKKRGLSKEQREKIARMRRELGSQENGKPFAESSGTLEKMELRPSKDPDFEEELTAELKRLLKLPEPGSVELKITFRQGRIETIRFLKSESTENQAYLEKKLPKLSLIGLEKQLSKLPSRELHLVISSGETR